MRRALFILVAACASVAGAARAESLDAAEAAFTAGRFVDAAQAAEALSSPTAFQMAARAWLAHCLVEADGLAMDQAAQRAADAARAALAIEPQAVEPRLQLAMALGVMGRRASAMEAVRQGYARTGKRLLDEALALAPQDAWAHALTGAWHLEVLRRGGRAGATFYGASEAAGLAAFDRARTLAPNDPSIALLYAVALLELDAQRFGRQAARHLAAASAAPAPDAFAREMRDEARSLAAVLATAGAQEAAARASARFG